MPTPLPSSPSELIAGADLEAARRAIAGVAVHTPTIACQDLAEPAGTPVALKAASLQGAGSFKLRGALHKEAALGERAGAGLVTASAGNHGRAVARAAAVRGVSCEVFMPRDAAVSKVAEVQRLGAQVPLHVRETGVELMLETRGPAHTADVLAALQRAGYDADLG